MVVQNYNRISKQTNGSFVKVKKDGLKPSLSAKVSITLPLPRILSPMYRNPLNNRRDKIRTCGLYVPNVVLYQTEPHPDNIVNYITVSAVCQEIFFDILDILIHKFYIPIKKMLKKTCVHVII